MPSAIELLKKRVRDAEREGSAFAEAVSIANPAGHLSCMRVSHFLLIEQFFADFLFLNFSFI